jgi:hypothetical protein
MKQGLAIVFIKLTQKFLNTGFNKNGMYELSKELHLICEPTHYLIKSFEAKLLINYITFSSPR